MCNSNVTHNILVVFRPLVCVVCTHTQPHMCIRGLTDVKTGEKAPSLSGSICSKDDEEGGGREDERRRLRA